jgi:hypothetical protein
MCPSFLHRCRCTNSVPQTLHIHPHPQCGNGPHALSMVATRAPPPNSIHSLNMTSAPRSAANRVFGIPELVEQILLDLHPYDILVAARINSTVTDTVQCSNIQRKLCFKHSPTWTEEYHKQRSQRSFSSRLRTRGHTSPDRPRWKLYTIILELCPAISMLGGSPQCSQIFGCTHVQTTEFFSPSKRITDLDLVPDSTASIKASTNVSRLYGIKFDGVSPAMLRLSFTIPAMSGDDVSMEEYIKRRDQWQERHAAITDASWRHILVSRVTIPVRVGVEVRSAGLLFSPQRYHGAPWDWDTLFFFKVFSPEEATIGNVLAFVRQVEDESIRVNSGLYSHEKRTFFR